MQSSDPSTSLDSIKIDLIVVGNSNTGKTSLIKRYAKGEESFMHKYQPSIGMSLEKKQVMIDKQPVIVHIWDTAGQQKFFSIARNYFKKADGVLVIFDITDKNSFDRINHFWMNQIKDNAPKQSAKIVIGNKVDLSDQRSVAYDAGKSMAQSLGFQYFETSAKTGQKIEQAISYILHECIKKVSVSQPTGINLADNAHKNKSGCFSNFKDLFSNMFNKQKQ